MIRKGFLHWVFPAMLGLAALDILLSGRDLTQAYLELAKETEGALEFTRHPVMTWVQRGVSLLLIAASLERIINQFTQQKQVPSAALTGTFVLFWLTTVAMPALFGAHMKLSHEYGYSLLLGLAVTLSGPLDRDRILGAARDGLFVFMLAGAVLVPVNPTLVLDTTYSQGLIPGLPRFGGLAVHPVGMGMLAQVALLLLWARPFQRRWLNMAAWVLGLAVLFVAQSKTAWLALLISACCMLMVRRAPGSMQRVGDPRDSSYGVVMLFVLILAVLAVLFGVLVADVPDMIDDFLSTPEGAQIATMTGRDRIWEVALQEWRNHPVFGYGPLLWDPEYRQAIAMPYATHGHNQMIDTLARCGTVGAIGLTLYALVLMGLSMRYARATHGLSLALFLTLALLSVSEVPLVLTGYGTELFTHLLLVVVLGAAAAERHRQRRTSPVKPVEPTFRTAT
ncbi:MAG TPA: O-antigen ligase family protein [Ramlibacter sp.]|jgi:O-antigen ligase|uniref:O-antigen ligase family protein n=1 Tax=Ramlibacter sp. TaxID=1917967 RepID=UPI002D276D75|nr:O-antigen ligase family protein [Ramlibacter sp.]HZY20177.1 O-antigen ligase family protein [Ramlibacter sp.]